MKNVPRTHFCGFSIQEQTASDYVVLNVLLSKMLHAAHVGLKKEKSVSS